jgi:peptidoglycan/LPS O-acetylase OafA/YrhL
MLAGATGLILFAATPIYRGYREVFIALGMLGLSIKLAEGGLVASVLGSKPLRALGSFSYSLYLVHYSVLQPVWHGWLGRMHLQPTVGFLSLLILGGSAAITVAYLFHLLFERPFIQPPKRLPSIDESSRIATV